MDKVTLYKTTSLPTKKIPNAIIWVRETPTSDIKGYISDVAGNYFPLKGLEGSGSNVTNADGSITIVTLPNSTQISVSTTLKNLIDNSLQPGDNISELVNDANYTTESYVDNKIVQTITDGDTTHSPSADVVYDKLLLKQNLPTGFVTGLQLSIHPTDNTKAIIAPGGYIITDFSDIFNVQAVPVQILVPIEFTPAYLNTSPSTYVALDINGSIVSQASPFDNSQRRTLCLIGNVVHSNLTNINVVNEIKAPILAPTNQLHDLIKAVGFLNLEGNLFSANGTNLSLNKSAGKIWGLGINGEDYLDPHRLTLSAQTALTFRYRLSVSPLVEFADTIVLDPTQYEPNGGGVLVPLSNNNRWSVQHINIFQSGVVRIQYGQHEYSSFVSARNAAFTETFVTEQNIADNAIFRAYVIMKKTCSNLQLDIANGEAEIIHIGKFGNAVGGSNASLTLANILAVLGYTPENEANKQTVIAGNESSTTFYGTIKGWIDWFKDGLASQIPSKATSLVDDDRIVLFDSEDNNKTKYRLFSQIKATLKTYFDTFYTDSYTITVNSGSYTYGVLNTWYASQTQPTFGTTAYGTGVVPSATFNLSSFISIRPGYKLTEVSFILYNKAGASASTTTEVFIQVAGVASEHVGNTGSTIIPVVQESVVAPWNTSNPKFYKALTVASYNLVEPYSYLQFSTRETQQLNTLGITLSFKFNKI